MLRRALVLELDKGQIHSLVARLLHHHAAFEVLKRSHVGVVVSHADIHHVHLYRSIVRVVVDPVEQTFHLGDLRFEIRIGLLQLADRVLIETVEVGIEVVSQFVLFGDLLLDLFAQHPLDLDDYPCYVAGGFLPLVQRVHHMAVRGDLPVPTHEEPGAECDARMLDGFALGIVNLGRRSLFVQREEKAHAVVEGKGVVVLVLDQHHAAAVFLVQRLRIFRFFRAGGEHQRNQKHENDLPHGYCVVVDTTKIKHEQPVASGRKRRSSGHISHSGAVVS